MTYVGPPSSKVVLLSELLERLRLRRRAGERLVFTNGCFELLHQGHVRYLVEAASLGEVLVVGLNSDASVRALKGDSRPLVAGQQRAEVVAGLGCVDYVTIFDEVTAAGLVEVLRPEIYVKGGDYEGQPPPEAALAEALGGEFHVLELVPGISTSELVRRIREAP